MSPQQQNNRNLGDNASANVGPRMGLSFATLATTPLGPMYDPLADWETNVSPRDNPVTDFLFEIVAIENPTMNGTSGIKSTQKTSTEKKSTQKQHAAHNKSTEKKPAQKKQKTK